MKLLIVLHDDSLSGAPMAALNLIEFLLQNSSVIIEVVIINYTGQLEAKFKQLKIKTYRNADLNVGYPEFGKFARLREIIYDLRYPSPKRVSKKINRKYDAVIFNTIVSLQLCKRIIEKLEIKKFLFLHELRNAIFIFLKNDYQLIGLMDGILAPSKAACNNLVNHGIALSKIFTLPLILNKSQLFDLQNITKDKTFIVGNLANISWPKGFDYFLAVAKCYHEYYPNDTIQFIWKGFVPGSFEFHMASYEIKNANLEDIVLLQFSDPDNKPFFNNLNVLLMTSKEDTYPFVMLEAAAAHIPTIAFKGSGGAEEFIDEFGGFTVPYLSMFSYVKAIKSYYEDRSLVVKHGQSANRLLRAKHIDNEELTNKIICLFKELEIIS